MELSAVVDIGTYFVKATYTLEGDGVLVVSCYEEILKIRAAITSRYYPNLQAVTRELCPNPQAQQQMTIYGLSCVQPGIDYFEQTLGNDSRHPVAAFKVARLFNPVKVKEMQPKAADLDALTAFPFLSQENLHHLKEELHVYLAKVVDISQSISLLEWWKDNSADLPFWSSAASKVILIQPSSAPAERVFSIMNRSFNDCQCNSLEDYIEASVMLQYNNRTNL